jgi:chemotaxis protein MotB
MAVEEDPPPAVPEWVVTFGDMMSLLLTFFIMLASMSHMKKDDQFEAMVESLRKRFGHNFDAATLVPGYSTKDSMIEGEVDANLDHPKVAEAPDGGNKVKAPVGDFPRVRTIRNGNIPTIGGVVYFDEGQTELTELEKQQLHVIVEEVGGKPQKIEIRGHTSRVPATLKPVAADMQGRYVDNWHLAYARCHKVMEFLIGAGIDPARIRLGVASEYEPIYTGIDSNDRKQNERVEVFMLNERVPEQDVTGSELPAGGKPSPKQPIKPKAE